MPGGVGGKDIYVCRKNGDAWEKPKNLGPDINTSGDEVFPVIRSDGTLFYSSDGLPGFGGLDIYSAREIVGKWILQRNEGLGMNSFTDDFAPCFVTDKKGYFSSDRDGGKGHDDIYDFTFTSRYISLDGTVLSEMDINKPVPNISVILQDDKGNVLNSTQTNSKGYFKFDNLDTDKKYMVKIDEKDPGFKGQNRFFYADNKNNIVRVTVFNDKGEKFVFRNLPSDPNSPPELTDPNDITIAGNLLFGENPSAPIGNSKLVLKDSQGNIIDEVTTNALGGFVFSKLPQDGNYILEIIESDLPLANAKIILTNKSGKEVKVLKADGSGKFNFHVLATEKSVLKDMKVEEKDLLMNIKGKLIDSDKKILAGKDVHLMDEKGNTIETVKTDADGKFEFKNLAADKKYMIGVDEKDTQLTNYEKLFITDLKGKVIRELFRDKVRGFKFHLLETDKNRMAELYVDDPWLKVLEFKNNSQKQELTIVEKVSYGLNEFKIDQNGQRVLDKVIQIMKDNPSIKIELSSHTDSRADDVFNKKLSEKRANFAVNYMITKGVDKTKIIPVGLGESKLINACGNNSDCTEEEHAINRRTEFKVIDNK